MRGWVDHVVVRNCMRMVVKVCGKRGLAMPGSGTVDVISHVGHEMLSAISWIVVLWMDITVVVVAGLLVSVQIVF